MISRTVGANRKAGSFNEWIADIRQERRAAVASIAAHMMIECLHDEQKEGINGKDQKNALRSATWRV